MRSSASKGQWTVAVCIFLIAITWVVFGKTSRFEFLELDDKDAVYHNPHITGGLNPKSAAWVFTHYDYNFYIPLTSLSHMVDYNLWGTDAGKHHLVNVLLHTASAVLLFLALRRMTGAMWPSAFVAAMFAIHPLHVESVAWVAERKDVLCGFFFMLLLYGYAAYVGNPGSLRKYLFVLGLFFLGLLCKPALVPVPFLLLLLDYWPLERWGKEPCIRLILEKIPLLVLSVAASIVAVQAQGNAIQDAEHYPLPVRVANAILSYGTYLAQMVYPSRLVVYYPHEGSAIGFWKAGVSALALASLTTLVIWKKRHRYLVTGWFWYLGMLVPVIGVIQVGSFAHADRFTYLPLIGIFVMVAWAVEEICKPSQILCAVASSVAGVVVVFSMTSAARQTDHWRNNGTLWSYVNSSRPSGFSHYNLGNAYASKGDITNAISEYKKGLQIWPKYGDLHNNLANLLIREGADAEAMEEYKEALTLLPDRAGIYYNIGNLLSKNGQPGQAIKFYNEALQRDPSYSNAHYKIALLASQSGSLDDAIFHYQKFLDENPESAIAHNNIGLAYLQKGNSRKAIFHYRLAVKYSPDAVSPINNLAWVLATSLDDDLRNGKEALELAIKANLLTSDTDAKMLDTLAAAHAETGDFKTAIAKGNEAAGKALKNGDPVLAEEIQKRITLYRSGHAYHDIKPAPPP